MVEGPIRIKGLRELQRELRSLSGGRFRRELSKTNRDYVQRNLAPEVAAAAPHRTGTLAASVRGLGRATAARLAVGSEVRVPYAGPINFGWPARNIAPQEFIYSTIGRDTDDLLDRYEEALRDLLRRAFPD